MIVSVMLPCNARYEKNEGTHLWFFYKQAVDFTSAGKRVTFIGWERNFLQPERLEENAWVLQKENQEKLEYSIPGKDVFEKIRLIPVEPSLFLPLENKLRSNNLVWSYLMSRPFDPYVSFLRETLNELKIEEPVEAIAVCCNSPSVELVGQELGIPVIHVELGPTRKKLYWQTAYWDLSGVNGRTEAAERFSQCRGGLKKSDLTRKELRALLMPRTAFLEKSRIPDEPDFKTGVAGQVEDDSNMLAYSRGFDNLELMKYVNFHFGAENVLFRRHPLGQTLLSGNLDLSDGTVEFLKRIGSLVTINSSMALEACLWGKPVMVMGDSPFALLSDDLVGGERSEDGHIEELNFLCLNYIIPYKFIFDIDYWLWRLTFPSEAEIRRKHLAFYCRQNGFASLEEFKESLAQESGPAVGEVANHSVLRLNIQSVPAALAESARLEEKLRDFEDCRAAAEYFEKENKKLYDTLASEVKYYQEHCENLERELKHFRELCVYHESEIKNYREAYEYNESEAKRLAGVVETLQQELQTLRAGAGENG